MIDGPHGQPLDDDAILHRLMAELEALDQPLLIGPINPLEALQLAGLLQLAQRHPVLSDTHRAIAEAVVETVRGYFEGRPTVLELLRRGDDPAEDALE